MAKFKSIAQILDAVSMVGSSKHKQARAMRFVFRHRRAYKNIIPDLVKAQQDHEREVHERRNKLRKEWMRS